MRFAPRYDLRILLALRTLDDRAQPIAETLRRVGAEAERLGLTRPSYVHVRRLVRAQRALEDAANARCAEIAEIIGDVARQLLLGLRVDPYDVADRVRESRLREEFVALSHKAP
jgi:hypothetical protein